MYEVVIRYRRNEQSDMKEIRVQKTGEASDVFEAATRIVPDQHEIDSAVLNRL
jgi:hypothetical protein